jgi:flagellar basal body-associated protein FliL
VPSVHACQDEEQPAVTKDAKDNKRGCVIIAALVALVVAALAYAILSTGTDPRSNGISPSGTAPAAPAGG